MYCKIKGCFLQSVFLPNYDGLSSMERGLFILNEKKFKWLCAFPQNLISLQLRRVEWGLWESVQFCARELCLAQGASKLVLLSHWFLFLLWFQYFQREQNSVQMSHWTMKNTLKNTEILPGHSVRVSDKQVCFCTLKPSKMNMWLQIHGTGTDLSAQVVSFDSIS